MRRERISDNWATSEIVGMRQHHDDPRLILGADWLRLRSPPAWRRRHEAAPRSSTSDWSGGLGIIAATRERAQRRSSRCPELRQGGRDESSAAVDGHDQLALAEDLHGVTHSGVGNLVLLGQRALGGQLEGDLAIVDPAGDVVSDLHIGVVAPVRINWHRWHVANIDVP